MRNVSEATIINIRKGVWESVSDDMWRSIGKQVGVSKKQKMQFVPIVNSASLIRLFNDSREYGNVFSITGAPGSGKTETAKWYAGTEENVAHVECSEYMSKKDFLRAILTKMGRENAGGSVADMMELITETFLKLDDPLLIIDEVDKLSESVLYFIISFYNVLHGKVGMVLLSTDYFSKRMQRGLRNNRKGYAEIFSRIGRRHVGIRGIDMEDIRMICKANGVEEDSIIRSIFNESEGDLRRVERLINKSRLRNDDQPRSKAA